MKRITVKIKNLKMVTDFKGFEGQKCEEMANEIDRNLEGKGVNISIEQKEYKPEYYMETNIENDLNTEDETLME